MFLHSRSTFHAIVISLPNSDWERFVSFDYFESYFSCVKLVSLYLTQTRENAKHKLLLKVHSFIPQATMS